MIDTAIGKMKKWLAPVPLICVFFAVFFVLLPPTNRENSIYPLFSFIVCAAVWAWYFTAFAGERQWKNHALLGLLVLYVAIVAVSTVISDGSLKDAVWKQGVLCVTIYPLFQVGVRENKKWFLCSFYLYLIVIVVWNIISYPGRASEKWMIESMILIGHPNIQIVYFLPALYCGYYLYQEKLFSGKFAILVYSALYAFSIFCAVYFDCLVNLAILILWGVLLVAGMLLPLDKIVRPWVVIAGSLLIFLGLQLYNPDNPGILDFLTHLIGRDPSLHGRTNLWAQARAYVAAHPLYGAGYHLTYLDVVFSFANHAHNIFMNALIKGGVPAFAVLLAILFVLGKKISACQKRTVKWAAVSFSICILFNLQFDVYVLRNLIGFAALLAATVSNATKKREEEDIYNGY